MKSRQSLARLQTVSLPGSCAIPLTVAVYLAATLTTHAQGKITFDGPPVQPPNTSYTVTTYSENGLMFRPLTPSTTFGRTGSGIAFYPDNGTAYVQTASGEAITFDSLAGVPFGLVSVDLAEYSTLFPYPWTVRFTGHKADGTTVTTSFTTDGIIDGTGPLADFQTFYFDTSFTGLTRVDVPADGWSMDNLVYSVPEPSTFSLLASGAVLLAGRSFTKRTNSRISTIAGLQ